MMAVGTDSGKIITLDLQLYFEGNDIEIVDSFVLSAGKLINMLDLDGTNWIYSGSENSMEEFSL